MIAIYDAEEHTLEIQQSDIKPHGGNIVVKLNRHGKTVCLKKVRLHIKQKRDGETEMQQSWPPKNVRLSKSNIDTLTTFRLKWQPKETVHIKLTMQGKTEQPLVAEAEFTAPKPPKPHPNSYWLDDERRWYIDPKWFEPETDE